MKITLTILSLLLSYSMCVSQSTERFIRIIGNSVFTYESNHMRINYEVSSTKKNSYRNYEKSTFEESLQELEDRIDSLNMTLVENSNFKYNTSDQTKSKMYYIDIRSDSVLDNVMSIQNEKYRIIKLSYLYEDPEFDVEQKLCEDAINDANDKANFICKNTNKKLGKILNIETRSNGCCSSISESSNNSEQRKYSITITYELLDK